VSNAPASAATFLKCRIKRFDDFCQIEKNAAARYDKNCRDLKIPAKQH